MRLIEHLAWPVTFLGLVVVLAAVFSYMLRDSELERQWLEVTRDSWRTTAGDAIKRKRAQLTMWPGVLAGAGVAGLGIVLLEIRRRTRDFGLEREELERQFEDGRPLAFKAPERGPD